MDKCHVPDYEDLIIELQKFGLSKFANRYVKYDALIGESRAIAFIEQTIKVWSETKSK